jgi:hypothetical protein
MPAAPKNFFFASDAGRGHRRRHGDDGGACMSDSSLEATVMVAIATGISVLVGSVIWIMTTVSTLL